MATNKILPGSRSAIRNIVKYAMNSVKVRDGLITMTGPHPKEYTVDTVCASFNEIKDVFQKQGGRNYRHSIISFHRDEKISPEEVLDFAREIAETSPFYRDFQTLICIHQDRNHLHAHMVSNSVSFIDGHKESNSREDVLNLMQYTNTCCYDKGYTVNQKGFHFDGKPIDQYDIASFSTKKYRLLCNDSKQSYLVDCMVAIDKAMKIAPNKEQFIQEMKKQGYEVLWKQERKYITFIDSQQHRIRDINLAKTFNVSYLSKERLEDELKREKRDADEYEYVEIESDTGTTYDYHSAVAVGTTKATGAITELGAKSISESARRNNKEQQKKRKERAHL